MQNWTHTFSSYLTALLSKASTPIPDLAISIRTSEQQDPKTIFQIKDGEVKLTSKKDDELPSCSMVLSERTAVAALKSLDVQGLLDSISNGTCILRGQIEPFIWLFSRMVDQKQDATTTTVDQGKIDSWLGSPSPEHSIH